MKRILLSMFMFIAVFSAKGQTLLSENFDALGDPFSLPLGWSETNQSAPVGITTWFRGGGGTTFGGFNGGQTGYIGANFNSTAGIGVISTWLMTPVIELQDGDEISFYTRTATGSQWADNLEMRISTNGAASASPSGATSVGDYTTLAVTVNPLFPNAAGYPQVWTQYTYTVTGLGTPTESRIAFRYTVPTSAGPSGNNSNFIGIDAFVVERPAASTDDFFKSSFAMYPNPASSVLNFASKIGLAIKKAQVTDLNGRIVKEAVINGASEGQINVSDLNAGVYFIAIESETGKGTAKFVKS